MVLQMKLALPLYTFKHRSWPVLLLAGLVVLFFWDSFFAGKALLMRDMFFDGLRWRQFATEAFWDGAIPLWNPRSNFGQPFVANPQSAVFYPLHWIFFLFSPVFALKLSLAVHLFIAAVSMYGLMRHWRLNPEPALLSAISITFSTYFIAQLEFHSVVATMSWSPLALLLTSRLIDGWVKTNGSFWRSGISRTTVLHILGLAGVFSIQYLAGNPQPFLFSLILVFGYAVVYTTAHSDLKSGLLIVLMLFVAGAVALCLSMPQFLLTSELLPLSARGGAIDPGLDIASLHPRFLLTWLLPFLFGRPGYNDTWWGTTLYEYWLGASYVGILPLILVSLTLLVLPFRGINDRLRYHRFVIVFFWGTGLFGLLLALGKYTPVYNFLYEYIPLFNRLRWPAKALQIVVFSVSVLSGFGFQILIIKDELGKSARRMLLIAVFFWFVIWIGLAIAYLFSYRSPEFFQWLTLKEDPLSAIQFQGLLKDYRRAIFVFGLSLAIVAVIVQGRRKGRLIYIAVLCLAYLNLFIVSREIHFIAPAEIYETARKSAQSKIPETTSQLYRVHSLYGEVQQQLYDSRDSELYVWGQSASVGDSCLPFSIFRTWGGGTLRLVRPCLMHRILKSLPPQQKNKLADILNIKWVVLGEPFKQIWVGEAPREVTWVERPRPLPRAFLAEKWHVIPDGKQALGLLLSPQVDPFREATVASLSTDHGQAAAMPTTEKGHSDLNLDSDKIISINYDWNRCDIEVQADNPALLVLNDPWHPGWIAKVDGQKAPVLRANVIFRGVMIKPGRHQVEFIYSPRRFRIGLIVCGITIFSVLGLLGIITGKRFRKTKRKKTSPL
jgi:hypothetical protein